MAIKRLISIACGVVMATATAVGYAEELTLAELKAKGATRVSKDELGPLVKGATLRFTSGVDFPTQLQFNKDGSFYATVTIPLA